VFKEVYYLSQKGEKHLKPFSKSLKKAHPEKEVFNGNSAGNPGILNSYLNISTSIIVALDKKGNVTYINKKGEKILGRPLAGIAGKNWFESFIPEEAAAVRRSFKQIISGKTRSFEYFDNYVSGATGQKRLIAWHNSAVYDAAGKIAGTLSSGDDITELKECNESLKQSDDRYKVTMETTTSAIASVDAFGRILEYNRAAAEIFGLNRTEMLGKSLTSIMTPESAETAMSKLKIVQNKGHSYGGEYRIRTKNGELKDVIISSAAIRTKDGKFVKTISVLEDITQRKYFEGVLRDSEEKYRTMFNSVSDAVFVHELSDNAEKSRFIAVNEIACSRMGYSRDELLKMGVFDITDPEKAVFVKAAMEKLIKEGHLTGEALHITKDGRKIPVDVTANVFKLGGKLTAISTARDITDRKINEGLAAEQAVFMELRANLWKLAADKLISEKHLIQGLLDAVGTAFKCKRAIYSIIGDDGLKAVMEWKDKNEKYSAVGVSVSRNIIESLDLGRQQVIDRETMLRLTPPIAGRAVKIIMNKLVKKFGGAPTITTPYFVNGRWEGCIGCTSSGLYSVKDWSTEKRELLTEAALIVSIAIESRRLEETIEKQIAYQELRARLWKLAADKAVPEEKLIQSLLDKTGRVIGAERVFYGKPDSDKLRIKLEWKDKKLKKSFLGVSFPLEIYNKFQFLDQKVYNSKTLVEDSPKAFRPLVLAAMNFIKKIRSDRPSLVTPYLIGGKREGVIICTPEDGKTEWTAGEKLIMKEAAQIVSNIIQQKRAEKKLEDSERLYREVFNNANDAIVMLELITNPGEEPKFHLLDFNDMTCRIFELNRKEMEEIKIRELVDTNGMERVRKTVAAVYGGAVTDEVMTMITGKNRKITVEIRAKTFDFGGTKIILAVVRDITEKKKAETALKESEEKYRELFNNANDGIYMNELDKRGRVGGFIEMNDMACKITGYERREFAKMTPRDIVSKESLETFPGIGKTLARTGRATYEQKLIRKDGKIVIVENNTHKFTLRGKPIVLTVMRDITERIKISNALKESEELYRTLINTSPDAVIMSDLKGRLIFASERMANLHGYRSAEELIGRSIFDFVDIQSKNGLIKEFREFISEGRQASIQYRGRRKNGSTFTGEINASILKGPDGLPKSAIATIRDVSERLIAVEALRVSEEKYRSVISRTGQIVYDYDVNNGIITWGGAVEEITGYTEEEYNKEVSIDFWSQMIHPDDREYVLDEFEAAQKACGKYHSEYRYRIKNGAYIYIEDDAVFLPDEDGKPCKMLGVMKNITHRKAAETALKESEEKFRNLSEQSMLGIAIMQDGVFKYSNNAFAKWCGYDTGEIMKWTEKDFYDLIHPDDVTAVMERMKKRLVGDGGLSHNYQFRIYAKDKRIKWFDIYASRMLFHGRPSIFITGADITALKDAENKLKLTIEELTHSNSELEQFAYVASHDMQEPLRMVSSYVQLLKKRYGGRLGQDADDFIGFAVDGSDRMQRLIKDLLAYSRVGTHKKEHTPVELNKVVETVLLNLDPVIKETGAVITYAGLPIVFADEEQMVQLIQNLLSNSIKFRKAGQKPELEITAEIKGAECTISVRDDGIGIDRQYFEKIFVIFQRLHGKGDYPGTGIGLSICKKIVESYGGRIWLESEEGKGATFYFTVPLVKK
jgi:PAS domain S-box-containing protein